MKQFFCRYNPGPEGWALLEAEDEADAAQRFMRTTSPEMKPAGIVVRAAGPGASFTIALVRDKDPF